MKKIYESVYELIGNTPLVRLSSYSSNNKHIYGKLEYFNPGGSVKDRLGMYLIEKAIQRGQIIEGTTVIEATAGNTGIGLALACRKYQLPLIVCVPEKFSVEKQLLMKALGAQVIVTEASLGMEGAKHVAKEIAREISNSYLPAQFENPENPNTYKVSLGPEIWSALEGEIDVFVAGAGSGGTFTGTANYLKTLCTSIRTVIVEPEGSGLNGGPIYSHLVEGIGLESPTPFMDTSLFDEVYTISDKEAFHYVKELALKEGLLVGSSSGAAMAAAVKEMDKREKGTIVVIFPDSSERYLSKDIYGEI